MKKINKELLETIRKNQTKLVVYGAGGVANIILKKLLCHNFNVACVAVTSLENNPWHIFGKPVRCIDDIVDKHKNSIFLVCTLEQKQEEIECILKSKGEIETYGITDEIYYQWMGEQSKKHSSTQIEYYNRYIEPYIKTICEICHEKQMSISATRKIVVDSLSGLDSEMVSIPRLVVVLGTKCSLRCRDCNNLMPLFKPQKDLSEQKIIRCLRNIAVEVQEILKCELIGGEPFLAENIHHVLSYVIDDEKIRQIEITTNGTILPNEKILSLLQNPKVLVRISDYGDLVDKKRITEFLNRYQIRYQVLELGSWTAPGGVESRRRNKNELRKIYKQCPSGYFCKTLFDGKLFACARAGSLYALGYMKEKEYIDVEKDCTAEEIKEFLLKDYSAACNYCDTAAENRQYVKPAIQL